MYSVDFENVSETDTYINRLPALLCKYFKKILSFVSMFSSRLDELNAVLGYQVFQGIYKVYIGFYKRFIQRGRR